MAHLYVTTDAFEAETLIEDPKIDQETKYEYHDIEMTHGEDLAKRLGFNPMCSVEMNGNVSRKELDQIATDLVKRGLYVATESEGDLRKYIPKDADIRAELVKIALQKWDNNGIGNEVVYNHLWYSNDLNQIREFNPFQ